MKKTIKYMIVGALAASMGLANADEKHKDHGEKHASNERHAGHMLRGYLEVAQALFKDDLAKAKEAAQEMVEHDKKSSLAKPAAALAESKDIVTARKEFKNLSNLAMKLAKDEKGYHEVFCPMVPGGGASWLQSQGKTVENPYMGARMPHCGKMKKR